ncbi:MAG TPA: vitamin B12-dependent ribonucleotide reductase, partial [Acidobacteriota bacterium]
MAPARASETRPGLKVRRLFTRPDQDPYATLEWERRSAVISGEDGRVVFEQKDIEVPRSWSQLALNVVASKYFRGSLNRPSERENSVRQLIGRVANSIADWGRKDGYFAGAEDADSFQAELAYLLVQQMASFNSPVWFNVGVEAKPQCSACFINSVQDSMSSILKLAHTEGMLFKHGSGTGTNLSPLRSSKEELAGGGEASGPVSFMKGYDAFAGVIKSGGKTRRAAKMVILNIDHPDVVEFINCKKEEEQKAWALIDSGYDGSFNGVAYSSVFYQNSNNSVRVTDEFMRALEEDGEWHTRQVTDGQVAGTYRARDLMRQIADAAWVCGDPGMQYDTTVNAWHTCLNTSRINASNPCSEFMFIDDSACNLASLNLMKFVDEGGEFDVASFRHAVDILITAMEIIVPNSSYPTPAIERNSHDYRPLGLGYANLGALLMARGLAYDSDGGRDYAAALTALLSGQGYLTSAKIARRTGPFPAYEPNQSSMLDVMRKHRRALGSIEPAHV